MDLANNKVVPATRPPRRNAALDGFRALAVIAVVAFHYLADFAVRASPSVKYYPFGDAYAGIPLLAHGSMGVDLFFMISGFVIALTLQASSGPRDFAIKRIARLLPAMVLCSLITAAVLVLLPFQIWQPHAIDFVPSWTFISEHTWSYWLKRPIGLVDTVYWTLFVEVKFYILAATIFFGLRRFAVAVPLPLALGILVAAEIVLAKLFGLQRDALEQFKTWTLYNFLPMFTAGAAFQALSVNRRDWVAIALTVFMLGILLVRAKLDAEVIGITVVFYLLFFGLIYAPRTVAIFAWRPLVAIGAWSYSLYLLHDRIGISLTYNLGKVAPSWLQHSPIIPLLVGLLLTLVSMAVFRLWENPAREFIRRATLNARDRRLPTSSVAPRQV